MKTVVFIILIVIAEIVFCAWLGHASVLPPPTGYLRPAQAVSPVIGFIPLNWDPSEDKSVVSYEVLSAPDLNGPWTIILRTLGTSASVTNHLTREFFQVLTVDTNGLNSLGDYQ